MAVTTRTKRRSPRAVKGDGKGYILIRVSAEALCKPEIVKAAKALVRVMSK